MRNKRKRLRLEKIENRRITMGAIREGIKIARNPNAKAYDNFQDMVNDIMKDIDK